MFVVMGFVGPPLNPNHFPFYFTASCMQFFLIAYGPMVLGDASVYRLWMLLGVEWTYPSLQLWGSRHPCWGGTFLWPGSSVWTLDLSFGMSYNVDDVHLTSPGKEFLQWGRDFR